MAEWDDEAEVRKESDYRWRRVQERGVMNGYSEGEGGRGWYR